MTSIKDYLTETWIFNDEITENRGKFIQSQTKLILPSLRAIKIKTKDSEIWYIVYELDEWKGNFLKTGLNIGSEKI